MIWRNKIYNIGTFVDGVEEDRLRENEEDEDDIRENDTIFENTYEHDVSIEGQNGSGEDDADRKNTGEAEGIPDSASDAEPKWYEEIEGIDGAAGIKNSASEELFKSLLEMFYDSIPDKADELNGLYAMEDWDNYTIKIHALKSSARLIGALELGDQVQLLENAGKEGDLFSSLLLVQVRLRAEQRERRYRWLSIP